MNRPFRKRSMPRRRDPSRNRFATADRWERWVSRSDRINEAFTNWVSVRVEDVLEGNWDAAEAFATQLWDKSGDSIGARWLPS